MTSHILKLAALSAILGLAATGVARADCESDLIQLEQAYKTPSLLPASKAALDDAKPKAVSAMKKDDDATCHTAVADGLAKAGLPMK